MTAHLAKKGNRWYVVLNETDTTTGKRRKKWISTGCTRKSDADQVRIGILSQHQQGTYVEPVKMTLAELLDRWLNDHAKLKVSPSTYDSYKGLVDGHLVPELGQIQITKLTPATIQRFYRDRLERGRLNANAEATGKPLSPRRVAYMHSILRQALTRAVRWGLLARNVTDAVTPPPNRRPDVEFWMREDAARFLESIRSHHAYPMYALALGTGMRRGELFGLTWADIDFQQGWIAVARSLDKPTAPPSFKQTKSDSGRRVISVSQQLLAVLHSHKVRQNEERLALGAAYHNYGLVFCQVNGKPTHPHNVSKRQFPTLIERFNERDAAAAEKAKRDPAPLKRITFHGLRHTHAVDLIWHGEHVKVISERLGHASITITMDTYGHVTPPMQSNAANAIDSMLPDAGSDAPKPRRAKRAK